MNKVKRAIVSSAVDAMQVTEADTVTRYYCFSPDFIGFFGHFPGYPILPAFVQVLTALSLAEEKKGCSLKLATVENAKFLIPLRPYQEIAVQCRERLIGKKPGCEVCLMLVEELAASFQLTFVERGNDA